LDGRGIKVAHFMAHSV